MAQATEDLQPAEAHRPGQNANQEVDRGARQGPGCLLWTMIIVACIMAAVLVALASAYAGWNSGIVVAREQATATGEAEANEQCQRIKLDVEAGNRQLAQTRLDYLLMKTPAPTCLAGISPTVTALYQQSLPSARPQATATAQPTATMQTAVLQATKAAAPINADPVYDLGALLSEAQADIAAREYQRAIDTLDAIIALDEQFEQDRVRALLFDALTARATGLYRSGRLSEAILTTSRAENYGDVAGLNYERSIAELYLRGLQLKIANPGESLRLLSIIVYEHGLGNYLNGRILSELQEAHRNYGDALAFRGEHCRARDQYEAALALQPAVAAISRVAVAGKRDQSNALCPALDQAQAPERASAAAGDTSARPGVGVRPSPAPVGQTG